jgi:hypothetical protein
MSRSEPNVDLTWCESHVIIKAILPDGTTLRLGSATLSNIPEPDTNQYSYVAKIINDSQVKISTTRTADQMSFNAENVDKELGLTLNNTNTVLTGAKVTCSKVFTQIENAVNPLNFNPVLWYDIAKLRALPNSVVATLPDLSAANHDAIATGSPIYKVRKINGRAAIELTPSDYFTINDSFVMKHIFAMFIGANSTFDKGSIIGSNTEANRLFGFADNTTQMDSPFPIAVRKNGGVITSPFDLVDIETPMFLNIKTNNPTAVRPYYINSMEGFKTEFFLTELIGFEQDLDATSEQAIEAYFATKYGQPLPYTPTRTWESKVLLTGEIAHVDATAEEVSIKIVSDTAPNVAFIATRQVQKHCPLIFKGEACGYSGPLTTCNKVYESEDGCSGRQNQHRFGGVVVKGELGRIIHGGLDVDVEGDERFPRRTYNDMDGRVVIPFY